MVVMAAAASGVTPGEDIVQRKEAVFSLCFFFKRDPFLEFPSRILPASYWLGLGYMPISKQLLQGTVITWLVGSVGVGVSYQEITHDSCVFLITSL